MCTCLMPYLSDMRKERKDFSLSHIIILILALLCCSNYVAELKIFAFKALGQESIVVFNPHTYYVSAFGGVKEH